MLHLLNTTDSISQLGLDSACPEKRQGKPIDNDIAGNLTRMRSEIFGFRRLRYVRDAPSRRAVTRSVFTAKRRQTVSKRKVRITMQEFLPRMIHDYRRERRYIIRKYGANISFLRRNTET